MNRFGEKRVIPKNKYGTPDINLDKEPKSDINQKKQEKERQKYNTGRTPGPRSKDQRKKVQFYVNEELDMLMEEHCLNTFQSRSTFIRTLLYEALSEKE